MTLLVVYNRRDTSRPVNFGHSPEQTEIAQLLDRIKTETGAKGNDPMTMWSSIVSTHIYRDDQSTETIIKYHLKQSLNSLKRAQNLLAQNQNQDAKEAIDYAQAHLTEGLNFILRKRVEDGVRVKKLLKDYWDVKTRLEQYAQDGIEPMDRQKYEDSLKLEGLYYFAAAISIDSGNTMTTIEYLQLAVGAVKLAATIGDFERHSRNKARWPTQH